MQAIRKISIVGTGKAAIFYSNLFFSKGFDLIEIVGRNLSAAQLIAKQVNADFTNEYSQMQDCDLILIAVKDDALPEIIEKLNPNSAVVAHCAGSVDINVLEKFDNRLVLYPLQSLSNISNISEVPILYEIGSQNLESPIHFFLEQLNVTFKCVDSEQRRHYHLAAVFANNFTNAILDATHSLSQCYQLDFNLLKPLLSQTYHQVEQGGIPSELQTGPAKRKDHKTIQTHLSELNQFEDLKDLYQAITNYLLKK
ncbi:MAG: DUF2520 domain-containing protein [Bacteroidia bacterium]|nr:DUF2520 domain-containing protein [Bacteroidia bacterium]